MRDRDEPTDLGLGFLPWNLDWRRRGRRCPKSFSLRGRSPEALSRSQCDLVVLESACQIRSGVQWLELLLHRLNPLSQLREGRDVEDVVRGLLLGVLLPGDEDRRAESRGPPSASPS
jgi:hypothetical protein